MNPSPSPSGPPPAPLDAPLAFIGGGNMASAIIGGLLRQGSAAQRVQVLEPCAEQRQRLAQQFPGLVLHAEPGPALAAATLVVWAVKPQVLQEAARAAAPWVGAALHLSVAAGVRSQSLAQWLGSERIVRAMPNTPALVGLGMTGLYARPGVGAAERERVLALLSGTGRCVWLEQEPQLDAVTALSGSGPAYVYYLIEAMQRAGEELGLSAALAQELALGTCAGAAQLAQASSEAPAVLRARVTSKGGTTHAAISHLEAAQVGAQIVAAIRAAHQRARELGDEFGA